MTSFAARFTPQAEADFLTAARWWRTNRPSAPLLFEKEAVAALELLSGAPEAGAAALSARLVGVRRIYMRATRYWIYYRVRKQPPAIEVLRIWHSSRARTPKI